jgi:hypothetical protein
MDVRIEKIRLPLLHVCLFSCSGTNCAFTTKPSLFLYSPLWVNSELNVIQIQLQAKFFELLIAS